VGAELTSGPWNSKKKRVAKWANGSQLPNYAGYIIGSRKKAAKKSRYNRLYSTSPAKRGKEDPGVNGSIEPRRLS